MQELFYNISLHGKRTVSNHDRFVLQFRTVDSAILNSDILYDSAMTVYPIHIDYEEQ